ncbi:sugar transferase, partial [Peribacillus frigoritolerans]|uniref:sugar transferase n=1 Tax=Peribacillus frigoritolerans TaxID=450367 RepID=UPI001E286091
MNLYQRLIKRSVDFFLSIIGIIIFCIPCVIVSVLIKLDSEGPIFFLQKRTGKDQKVFKIIKFRTMQKNTPSMSGLELKEDNPSITKIGKILRKYSIDEIPQLINVVLGHMSVVGPRPDRENPAQPYT